MIPEYTPKFKEFFPTTWRIICQCGNNFLKAIESQFFSSGCCEKPGAKQDIGIIENEVQLETLPRKSLIFDNFIASLNIAS
jgi:hypothetical protein